MRVFRFKKAVLSRSQERFAVRLAGRILEVQRKIADRMNGWTAGYSVLRWQALLLLFCLVFGGYCIYLVYEAIN